MTLEGLRKVNIAASATIVASFCGAVFLPNGWGTASWCGFFGAIRFNAYLAHSRAEQLIAAVEEFRSRNARYPEGLEQIVPGYIAAIPRPKYVLVSDGVGFDYAASAAGHTLRYTALPPYGIA